MFRRYGIFGLILILLVELNFIFKIQPLANWYFPIIWFGYILVVDALIYRLKKNSLISNRLGLFFGILVLSAFFWWIYEYYDMGTSFFYSSAGYWTYHNLGVFGSTLIRNIFGTLSFATAVPAVFETAELLKTVHLFDSVELKKKHRISKTFLHVMVLLGITCLVIPFVIKNVYLGQIMWLGFFFFLDPFNYTHHRPSIISHLKDKKLVIPLALFFGGIVCGFFWEFWNYWAIPRWSYTMPPLTGIKIFEMPLLGYICYGFFAWSLYAMYHSVGTILHGKTEKI